MLIEFNWDDIIDPDEYEDSWFADRLREKVREVLERAVCDHVRKVFDAEIAEERDLIEATAKRVASVRIQKALKALEVEV